MGSLLAFSVFASVITAVLGLCYRALLRDNDNVAVSRLVILSIFAVPALLYVLPSDGGVHAAATAATANLEAPVVMPQPAVRSVADAGAPWLSYLLLIYMVGAIAAMLPSLVSIVRLLVMRGRARHESYCGLPVAVVDSPSVKAPFTSMGVIFISESDYRSDEADMMLCHEAAHLRFGHWIDLMVTSLAAALMWYNPMAWMLRAELRKAHEYQADGYVLAGGHDVRQYQLLLIKKAVGPRFPSLANSLNHSKLKKRITMMNNQKKSRTAWMRALLLAPAAVAACALCSTDALAAVIDGAKAATMSILSAGDSKVTTNRSNTQATTVSVYTPDESNGSGTTTVTTTTVDGNTTYTVNGREMSADEIAATGTIVVVGKSDSTGTKVETVGAQPTTLYYVDGVLAGDADAVKYLPSSEIGSIEIKKDADVTKVFITTKQPGDQPAAGIAFGSINNDRATNVELVFSGLEGLDVSGAVLSNDGAVYNLKSSSIEYTEPGGGNITLHFKRLTKFKNTTVRLYTNHGEFDVVVIR